MKVSGRATDQFERETGFEPATLSLGNRKRGKQWRGLTLSTRQAAAESGT